MKVDRWFRSYFCNYLIFDYRFAYENLIWLSILADIMKPKNKPSQNGYMYCGEKKEKKKTYNNQPNNGNIIKKLKLVRQIYEMCDRIECGHHFLYCIFRFMNLMHLSWRLILIFIFCIDWTVFLSRQWHSASILFALAIER